MSVLAMLRQRVASAQPHHTITIIADPVFARNDERLPSSNQLSPIGAHTNQMGFVANGKPAYGKGNERALPRLFSTRWEADKIVSFVGKKDSIVALDFDANRDFITSSEFSDSRFLHLATHTLINDEHAELSGIALSNFDSEGRRQDGFLRTSEIYRLRLLASLVVLSSCQSALGKEVKGEGLVGLTHAFMYAGVPRVVASLWTVSDNPTAQLMAQFYLEMLKNGRTSPAAALRSAQLTMLKDKRWESPYFWGGFMLQGEWLPQ
jgi:CHAT domain-containing protein